jgi:hypothetical protein
VDLQPCAIEVILLSISSPTSSFMIALFNQFWFSPGSIVWLPGLSIYARHRPSDACHGDDNGAHASNGQHSRSRSMDYVSSLSVENFASTVPYVSILLAAAP